MKTQFETQAEDTLGEITAKFVSQVSAKDLAKWLGLAQERLNSIRERPVSGKSISDSTTTSAHRFLAAVSWLTLPDMIENINEEQKCGTGVTDLFELYGGAEAKAALSDVGRVFLFSYECGLEDEDEVAEFNRIFKAFLTSSAAWGGL